MKNVSYIELVFENCESVKIDAKYIGDFSVTDIKEEILRIACNAICRMRTANEVAIEIFSEADVPFVSFGHESGKTVFERIMAWDDITHINIVYEDGEEDYLCVEYDEGINEGKLGAPNILQSTKLSDLDNLYILISVEGADIDKIFPDEEINDKEFVKDTKFLYGVYDEEEDHE